MRRRKSDNVSSFDRVSKDCTIAFDEMGSLCERTLRLLLSTRQYASMKCSQCIYVDIKSERMQLHLYRVKAE